MTRTATRAALRCLAAGLVLASAARPAHALLSVCNGDRPVKNHGWPLGCEKVGNVPGRLGFTDGPSGGQYVFYYRSKTTAAFNAALKTFGGIRTPRLELVVHDGPGPEYRFGPKPELGEERPRVDWTFKVWHPASWHRTFNDPTSTFLLDSRYSRKPVPPPRIDVYVGEIVWDRVVVPKHLHVTDRRAAAAPVPLLGSGMVVGDVYDMATGQPVAGAEVSLVRRGRGEREVVAREVSDALGSFAMPKIPAGRFLIQIRARGYAARGVGAYDNQGTTYHKLLAELVREANAAGVVRDTNGNPIADAEVTARCVLGIDGRGYKPVDASSARTDAQGRFTIRGLPAGYATLRCRKGTLHQRGSIFKIHRVPAKEVVIVMQGTGVIRGKVTGADADPKRPAHVHLVAEGGAKRGTWGGSMRCKPDGTFEFRNVPPGDYVLSTRYLPHGVPDEPDVVTAIVTVTAGKTVEVTLRR